MSLERFPFVVNSVSPNEHKKSDYRTIHYTKVYRWVPESKSDLESPKKTFRKSLLPNNSLVELKSIYPIWFFNKVAAHNAKKDEKMKYLNAKVLKFGSTKYLGNEKFKTRHNGRTQYATEKKIISYAKYYLDVEKSTFFFDPKLFDTTENHILKIENHSELRVFIKEKNKHINLEGKEVRFAKQGDKYLYELSCNGVTDVTKQKCRDSLNDVYAPSGLSLEENLKFLQDANKLRDHSYACQSCELFPKVSVIDNGSDFTFSSSIIMKGDEEISEAKELYENVFAIDEEFRFLADYFENADDFQNLIAKYREKLMPMINYPNDIYASYQYTEGSNYQKTGSRSTTNTYSACMFRKTQRAHLANIITGTYRKLNPARKTKFYQCMKTFHPNVFNFSSEKVVELLGESDHPCSSHILVTGLGLQYGDISSSKTFTTLKGHSTHSGGRCIDVRPLRDAYIKERVFKSKIMHQVFQVENQGLINEVNNLILDKVIEGNEEYTSLINDVSEDSPVIDFFRAFSDQTKDRVLNDYVEESLDLYNNGGTNAGIEAYFKYSLNAIDGKFTVKDESSVSEFIKLLKNIGADEESIYYIYGRSKSSHWYFLNKHEYEKTKSIDGHVDHIHFCFDERKALEQVQKYNSQLIQNTPVYIQNHNECLQGLK